MSAIWKPQPKEVYVSWVESILTESSEKLNDWERGFIESVGNYLDRGWNLSRKQAETLERIYAEKTS